MLTETTIARSPNQNWFGILSNSFTVTSSADAIQPVLIHHASDSERRRRWRCNRNRIIIYSNSFKLPPDVPEIHSIPVVRNEIYMTIRLGCKMDESSTCGLAWSGDELMKGKLIQSHKLYVLPSRSSLYNHFDVQQNTITRPRPIHTWPQSLLGSSSLHSSFSSFWIDVKCHG